jgi:hypothetical protein
MVCHNCQIEAKSMDEIANVTSAGNAGNAAKPTATDQTCAEPSIKVGCRATATSSGWATP